jgi:hypothetical protein
MLEDLTISALKELNKKNKLNIKGINYLNKTNLINSIMNTDWFKNSSYNGGGKKEETKEPKEDDFKPLSLDDVKKDEPKEEAKEDKDDFKPIVLEEKKDDVIDDDEPSTTITYDKKGNLIVVSFIPKNKIKLV